MARRENGEAVNDSAGRTDGQPTVETEAAIGMVKPGPPDADTKGMDLSKVLGDVYADDVPPPSRPSAPEWADEATLDEAFANWTPGPPPEAPAAEHEMAAHGRIDDDLAAALTEALSSEPVYVEPVFEEIAIEQPVAYELAPAEFEPEPEVEPEPQPARAWSRGDDDVLSSSPGGRRRGLFSRLSR